ncbi:hypothetical protein R7P75_04465 [Vibrio sp. 2175-1]|uniref:hypothetical protein n=1 Tax=Vibrio TaxID=662 RepID=UPI001CDD38D6|nr:MULTISPECIES: hypothetical protein [Vibrio]MCA2497771.1 hypothetical protein [Vibrio alginolyticus]MDW2217458.1 hypothetical protein [Vibrio sp. 2175-1]
MFRLNYDEHRDRIFPIIEQSASQSGYDYANEINDALLSGRAFLFAESDAFMILEPYDGDKVHVAFAYSFSSGCAARYQPEVERLSRLIGAKVITFDTVLTGAFAYLVKKIGYKEVSKEGRIYTYAKELV